MLGALQGMWLVVLAAGYAIERLGCRLGLPNDCISEVLLGSSLCQGEGLSAAGRIQELF